MIKYIGSKRTLIPLILKVVKQIQTSGSVCDLFSGTSRVGHALKKEGYCVTSNDHNTYAAVLSKCYVEADKEDHIEEVEKLVKEFNSITPKYGYFTKTFCEDSRFFQPKNGEKVDAIREEISKKGLNPELEAIMLVSLMEAADRVDSTTGVQMAYLKSWAKRSYNDLELRVPEILPQAKSGKGRSLCLDAKEAVKNIQTGVFYLDPPYNQHKYLGNYHIFESLVLWDCPEVYGVAKKRVDCKERFSVYNSKKTAKNELESLILSIQSPHVILSFSDEGFVKRGEFEHILGKRGEVVTLEVDYKRYVGAQIGIHNKKGKKAGKVSHLRNTEYLYVVSEDTQVLDRIKCVLE